MTEIKKDMPVGKWKNFTRPPSAWPVARDIWSGEGDICKRITEANMGLDAAGATGILAKKEKTKEK